MVQIVISLSHRIKVTEFRVRFFFGYSKFVKGNIPAHPPTRGAYLAKPQSSFGLLACNMIWPERGPFTAFRSQTIHKRERCVYHLLGFHS